MAGRSLTTELHPNIFPGRSASAPACREIRLLPHPCALPSSGKTLGQSSLGASGQWPGGRDSLRARGWGWPRPGRPSSPGPPRGGWCGREGPVLRPRTPGGQTRETSAWKLEERRAPGLTRVSMDTCVLHVPPLLPPEGCWYLRLEPKMPFRCQRRHFRRSSACTWGKGSWSSPPLGGLLHC